jgi:HME family heavy-metal exporter
VATVILGGLLTSTLLEFFVRPALFWQFGMKDAARVVSESKTEVALVEEEHAEDDHRHDSERRTTADAPTEREFAGV